MELNKKVPNPGSDEAVKQGCECPILDNGRGRGYYGGSGFVISEGCPLHDVREDDKEAK